MQRAAKALGKPYYIGSFGVARSQELALQDAVRQDNLHAMLSAIRRAGVQLASFWCWNTAGDMEKQGWNLLQAPARNNQREAVWNALRGDDGNRPPPPKPCFGVMKTLLSPTAGSAAPIPSSMTAPSACTLTLS
ncbi:hypothetical protein [Janthinobacterium sp. MDT1-19]|uniref:hypothetical protein n=1 Tax=Janthinobacterium sp. MDT1-19 TaxID=1259339 RepID=UPI003F25D7F2